MKFYAKTNFGCAIVLLLGLVLPIRSVSAASLKLKVCIDTKGQITARSRCPKGQSLNSESLGGFLAGIQSLTGPKGDKGDPGVQGVPGVSDLAVTDGTVATSIPKCTPNPDFPNSCITPGSVTTSAACPADKRAVSVICVGKPAGDSMYIYDGIIRGDGQGYCSFYNNLTSPVVGKFYTRIICMPQPTY